MSHVNVVEKSKSASRFSRVALIALLVSLLGVGDVFAGGWKITRLKGDVSILLNGSWHKLSRGDQVPLGRFVRTAANGRARLSRGGEIVDMEPKSEVQILENAGGRNTVVHQRSGEISVEANRRKTKHFAVQTRFLVAVVKGTRFTVRADQAFADVAVKRGIVEVRDLLHKRTVDVVRNQSAESGYGLDLKADGKGKLEPVVKFEGSAYVPAVKKVAPVKPAKAEKSDKQKPKFQTNGRSVAKAKAEKAMTAKAKGKKSLMAKDTGKTKTKGEKKAVMAKDSAESKSKAEKKDYSKSAKQAEKAQDKAQEKAKSKADKADEGPKTIADWLDKVKEKHDQAKAEKSQGNKGKDKEGHNGKKN